MINFQFRKPHCVFTSAGRVTFACCYLNAALQAIFNASFV